MMYLPPTIHQLHPPPTSHHISLFDAQNNNQAGYNAGEEGVNMKYYASSVLPIQFSMGHGCGNGTRRVT